MSEKKEHKNPIVKAIAEIEEPFIKLVTENEFRLKFASEAIFAKRIVMQNKQLMQCEPASIKSAILDAASIGLTLDPARQHATLVPRNVNTGGNTWMKRAYLTPMYRGLVHIAIEDGVVVAVEADVVYEDDQKRGKWRFQRGINPILEHSPSMHSDRTASPFLGTWTLAIIRELGPDRPIINFTPAEDVYKGRDASEAYRDKNGKLSDDAPWVKWFGEMAKKFGIKRDQKLWPHVSTRLALAVDLDNKAEHSGVRPTGEQDEVIMIGHDQTETLTQLLHKARFPEAKFLEAFGIESLSELPEDRLAEAKERLEARAEKVAEKLAEKKEQKSDQPPQDSEQHGEQSYGSDEPPPMTQEELDQWRADLEASES